MNRYYVRKNEEVRDLVSLRRDRLRELAEIDGKILIARQWLLELAEIDRNERTSQDLTELAEIDQKIVTEIIENISVTEIEVERGEVSPRNFAVLVGLGYQVVRLPSQKERISWKLVGSEDTSE